VQKDLDAEPDADFDADFELLQKEAAQIDTHKYSRRSRAISAILLGAFLAGLTWLVLEMIDQRRNPCARVVDYLCAQDPEASACRLFQSVLRDSNESESAKMRSQIRSECVRKIERLEEEEGVVVP